jgi:hypothetical protein
MTGFFWWLFCPHFLRRLDAVQSPILAVCRTQADSTAAVAKWPRVSCGPQIFKLHTGADGIHDVIHPELGRPPLLDGLEFDGDVFVV